jgi:putative ABC transport system ATP-binding protein
MMLTFERLVPAPLEGNTAPDSIWQTGVSFSQGKLYSVYAPSGKGKSTLMHILLGIRRDFSGLYAIDGKDSAAYTPDDWAGLRRDRLASVYQDLKLFPHISAAENIAIKASLTGFSSSRWRAMAERLGIANLLERPCRTLSMGQQQRVAIVRALSQPFQYLLMDEPVSHLDRENARLVIDLALEEAATQGAAVLLTGLNVQDTPAQFQPVQI